MKKGDFFIVEHKQNHPYLYREWTKKHKIPGKYKVNTNPAINLRIKIVSGLEFHYLVSVRLWLLMELY